MVEHTKGPWSRSCFQVYGADNSRIAHTGMGNLPPSRSSESEANARLIESSPDLLAAAEDFVAKVDRGEARSTKSYAAFKAAIAIARGTQ